TAEDGAEDSDDVGSELGLNSLGDLRHLLGDGIDYIRHGATDRTTRRRTMLWRVTARWCPHTGPADAVRVNPSVLWRLPCHPRKQYDGASRWASSTSSAASCWIRRPTLACTRGAT